MARVKVIPSRGCQGHAHRQKRKNMDEASRRSRTGDKSQPGKGHEATTTATQSRTPTATSTLSTQQPASAISLGSSSLAALTNDFNANHVVITMSILSSSRINQKIRRALDSLKSSRDTPPSKPIVIVLHAKAATASKVISIAEIVKRELETDGGTWFQYTVIGEIIQEKKVEAKTKRELPEDIDFDEGGGDEALSEGNESAAFETMKTPFERAIEGKPQVRATPTIAVYISRTRIETLRKSHGEQTNT